MDAIDLAILRLLQEDASLPVTEIAARINLSQTPTWRRIQKLEQAGVIARRVALLDPAAVGRDITVFVDVETGGIPTSRNGRVDVDLGMATPVPGVWAVGDISNDYQLKHLANAEAKVAFWNMAHPDDQREVSYRAVPSAVFSNPQVATVGLTETQANESGQPIKIGRRDYGGTAYGWALEDETSFAKVIINAETEQILGAHIIGPQAASLIQPLIQAMELGQSARTISEDVFYIHPALTEVVENALLEALN